MDTKNNFLECLQDGLFFGLDYLKQKLTLPELSAYFKDGSLIFTGQKTLYREDDSQKEEISFLLSYLSGAYTLISCFTEKNFNFKIFATHTKSFSHKEGEEQAILKAGAVFYKDSLKSLKLNEVLKLLEKQSHADIILLSENKISLSEIKKILQDFPECSFALEVNLSPSDLEEWTEFKNIQTVYPFCLQGHFPLLKMQWTQ